MPSPRCPLEMRATTGDEPIAPLDALMNEAAKAWFSQEYQPWARENKRRNDRGREWCLKRLQYQDFPPPSKAGVLALQRHHPKC